MGELSIATVQPECKENILSPTLSAEIEGFFLSSNSKCREEVHGTTVSIEYQIVHCTLKASIEDVI